MMLTQFTQTAITLLHRIASGNNSQSTELSLSTEEWNDLLHKLETGGIIQCLPNQNRKDLSSYQILHPLHELTVLDLLTVLGEPIHCDRPISEISYSRHGAMAKKIGILNQVTRTLLSEIKLSDW